MAITDNLLRFPKPTVVDQSEHDPHDAIETGGNNGSNMSDTPISKDWAERQLSDLNHKIDSHRKDWEAEIKDMNRKFDHKFELLVADSNAKFDKMFLELKSASERNDLRADAKFAQTDAIIARVETNITRWLVGILFAIAGLAFSFWRMAHDGGLSETHSPITQEKAVPPAPTPEASMKTTEPPTIKPVQTK